MTEKKFFQFAGILVAFVWVFCLTFFIAAKVMKKNEVTTIPSTNPLATTAGQLSSTTTVPTVTVPSSQYVPIPGESQTNPQASQQGPSQDYTIDANNVTVTVSLTNPPPTTNIHTKSKQELIQTYVDAINTLKNSRNFTMTKHDKLDATIDDATGGSIVINFVQNILNEKAETTENYNFQNGYDAATGQTPLTTIAPLNAYAKVDPEAITNATANDNSDGGYTVILTLKDELQTYSTPAVNHSTMVEVIDVASMIPSGVTISDVNITYTATTIKATFDSQGQLTSMEHYLNVAQGGGSGKMGLIPIKITMHGKFTSKYTFIYP